MLSKRVKYAIKTLIFLDVNSGEQLYSAKFISEKERIPLKFLEQILRQLKQHQLIKSVRGAVGGYQLSKSSDSIKILDLVRIIDGPVALLPCASIKFYEPCHDCIDEEICTIRQLLVKVRDSILPILDTSIADLRPQKN